MYRQLLAHGEALLATQPDRYAIQGPEHTLLATARDVEGRVFTLVGLYRLTGQKKFADRARTEMLTAATFPDWYPKHFLDTAEMTAALGVGYDWLYNILSPEDRATIRTAIISKGIDPYLSYIRRNGKLITPTNNWVQVCNGGVLLGALAIADEDPERARKVLDDSREEMQAIMQRFAPDGGFEEGPVYWGYATIYNVLYLSALETALGTDFGLSQSKGFAETGNYRMQTIGPLLKAANFADADEGVSLAPQMFWMADHFNRPDYARHEHNLVLRKMNQLSTGSFFDSQRFAIFTLFWYKQAAATETIASPLAASFQRINAAFLRSSWNDPNTWYVAFKGGDANVSHSHLDLGSFILDALGQRWAIDLGPDSYGLPGYFGPQRWTYYRTRTEGHNTLTVDGMNEDLDAHADLVASERDEEKTFAIADLGQSYKGKLSSWKRGVALLGGKQMLVQDELTPIGEKDIIWNVHTNASVKITTGGAEAMLTQNGVNLRARILSPAGAHFVEGSGEQKLPQARNEGVTNLMISLQKQRFPVTIAILFVAASDTSVPQHLRVLTDWKNARLSTEDTRRLHEQRVREGD